MTAPRVPPLAVVLVLLRGGAAGVAAGLGLLAIPGIGPVAAAGWLASLAAGAVAGGATGGIIGALVESGTSKENAAIYARSRSPWRRHRHRQGLETTMRRSTKQS